MTGKENRSVGSQNSTTEGDQVFVDMTADSISDAMSTLDRLPKSRARSMTQTKLVEALMWLQQAQPSA